MKDGARQRAAALALMNASHPDIIKFINFKLTQYRDKAEKVKKVLSENGLADVYDFIEEKYGKRGVRNLLNSFKGGSVLGRKRNIFRIFDLSQKQFNFEFRKYARNKFKKFLTKENYRARFPLCLFLLTPDLSSG